MKASPLFSKITTLYELDHNDAGAAVIHSPNRLSCGDNIMWSFDM